MLAFPQKRTPREVVVDHGDGTVSPLMEARFLDVIDGLVRARRAGDVFKDYPTEEASGTARKAPSTHWERESGEPAGRAAGLVVGTQSAPPQSGLALGIMGCGA